MYRVPTEALMRAYLVDFETAERIKTGLAEGGSLEFTDVLGLPQTQTVQEIAAVLSPAMDTLAAEIARQVLDVNGNAPSALFLAGGGSYTAPVQTVGSFLGKGKVEAAEVTATYRPAVKESSLDEIFPAFMTEALREALPAMGRKLKGFDRADAVLTAVESRSSSPIRILRDKTGMSLCKQGIYPAGEGAGYAGGIVSAAVDGIFVAEKIAEKYGWMK